MAYIQEQQLDGFNPLKAIGRALGATGRAMVSAIPGVGQAASAVLTVASKMPASAKDTAKKGEQPQIQPSGNTQTGASSSTLVESGGAVDKSRDALLDTVNALLAKQTQPQIQPTPTPIYIPSAGGQSYAPPPATSGAAPSWMIPAAIGGVGLLAVMLMSRK